MEYVISVADDPSSAIGAAQSLMGEKDSMISLAIGPERLNPLLEECKSGGASKTFRIMDRDFMGSDSWVLSRIYAAFIDEYCSDAGLIIFSRYSSAVPMLSHLLQVQQFCYVREIGRDDVGIYVIQDYDGVERKCRVPAGSVVSLAENVSIPYSKKDSDAEIEVIGRKELKLAEFSVGIKGSRIITLGEC
ncbi:MAG: hypothetical protein ACOX1N_05305 [Candidatus Methanomethylophilaceae archaeon]|jgi:electron transfer flavoprotein alpha/beta subunit